ncbi:hypothetical protein [Salibaculum griseiflavum]|uniref:Uncharacterized protein n=1 Tax=Salibaculum griseiflavum TaxID=1914409 RepID=A0A2V1P1M1_9RHOB|nr:hypothetical protein [Salibaculum griseiflavum]PWG15640.1 hypothetical protein DFK10_15855 [Salibaculum griseiflavum]
MRFIDNMLLNFNANCNRDEVFLGDYKERVEHEGEISCMSFINRICPSEEPYGRSIPYKFQMRCDNFNMHAEIRATLHHDRKLIDPEDLIEIGNDLNSEFSFCPFFFDRKMGRGVVATEWNMFGMYIPADSKEDECAIEDGLEVRRDIMNRFSQLYWKLNEVAKAYIKHDCV